MKKILIPCLAAAALTLASTDYKHPKTGAFTPQSTTTFDTKNKKNFVLMDPGGQYSVTCSGLQITPLPDGRLKVVANVRNRENRRIQVQINCVFKDTQGFSTGDETPWQTLVLTENGQESVAFESANDKAKKYTVRVRQAR